MTTLADMWDELKHDAANEWQKIAAEAKLIENTVAADLVIAERAILPIAEAAVVALMQALKGYALSKVGELAKDEFAALTGSEKQSEVITHLIQIAEGLGHDITPILINAVRTLAQNAWMAMAVTKPN